MSDIAAVKVLLLKQDLNELKKKTHIYSAKDAIAKAVEHYLTCEHT